VPGYNAQGFTIVRIDDVAEIFGELVWNEASREVHVAVPSDYVPAHALEPATPPPRAALPSRDASAFELRVLELINDERTARNLTPLVWHDTLGALARAHSEDMARNDFLSHTSSDGTSFDQRIIGAGIPWLVLAENVGAGQSTPEAVVAAWMSSPGHRENILEPRITHVGIGYAYNANSRFGHFWTQKFLTPQ
jgi:uncharacterized protein YkwD